MVWITLSVLDMAKEEVTLCIVLGLFLLFFCVSSGMFCVSFCPFLSAWPPRPYTFYPPYFSPYDWYPMYWALLFIGIPLTLIGMPILSWFTSKPNVDFGNTICPSIIFTVSADGVKDCLRYWSPSPMISQVTPRIVSLSYMSSYNAWPLMNCLSFRSSF